MRRKKGNPQLWSETGIFDPHYPHIKVRITELAGPPFLYLGRQINGKAKYTVLRPKVTKASLGDTDKERRQKAKALGLDAIAEIAKAESAPPKPFTSGLLTLGQLADRYERDGLVKCTAGYRRDALASIRRIAAFLGALAESDATDWALACREAAQRSLAGAAPEDRMSMMYGLRASALYHRSRNLGERGTGDDRLGREVPRELSATMRGG